ncbi:hypothetical protein CAEBREN_00514 [Caenorhabditis brenneri]|uniref:Uncharacterized protein n=1 Tax=Caenorhabditis brenneri TaxID=135651 RepID=G0N7H2_CAEBE|nr:hypothetical protein CAEBREN_00514 [Caenorhabditis brenneri]
MVAPPFYEMGTLPEPSVCLTRSSCVAVEERVSPRFVCQQTVIHTLVLKTPQTMEAQRTTQKDYELAAARAQEPPRATVSPGAPHRAQRAVPTRPLREKSTTPPPKPLRFD